jgi:hypothetical protein
MIYQLVKRDQAWKTAPWCLLLFAVGAALIEQGRSVVLMPLAMMLIAFTGAAAQSQDRARGFFAALPVTRQEIFQARTAALMVLIWAPALSAAVICAATGRFGAEAFIAVAAAVTPLSFINQSFMIREIPVPGWANTAIVAAVCGLAAAGMAIYPDLARLPFVPIIAGGVLVSAIVFAFTWSALPHTGVPGELAAPVRLEAHSTGTQTSARFPFWIFSWWDPTWFVILFNMTFSGPWFSAVLFLWAGSIQSRERYRFLDSLPVSRRVLLAARVVLLVAPLVLGYVVGINLGFAGTNPWNKIYISAGREWPPTRNINQCGTLNVTPPLEYWRPATNGTAPSVQAPWGESYQLPVVRVYGYEVYNPYGVGCGNSKRFLDWQYERASLAVYGKPMPKNDARVTAPVHIRTEILNIGGILSCSLMVILPLYVNDWWRFQRLQKSIRYTALTIVIAAYFAVLLLPSYLPGAKERSFVPSNAMQVLSWWLPDSMAAVIPICILVPLALYFLTERVFLRSEIAMWDSARKL